MKKALFSIGNRAFFISRFVYPRPGFSEDWRAGLLPSGGGWSFPRSASGLFPRIGGPVCCLPKEVGLCPVPRPGLFPRVGAADLLLSGGLEAPSVFFDLLRLRSFSPSLFGLSPVASPVASPALRLSGSPALWLSGSLALSSVALFGLSCLALAPPPAGPGSVAQDAEHRTVGLLLGEQTRVVLVVGLVAVDDDVFRGGDQAVLDAAEAAE